MDKENSDVSAAPADLKVSTGWETFCLTWMPFIVDPVSKMRLYDLVKIKETIIKYFIFLYYLMGFINASLL